MCLKDESMDYLNDIQHELLRNYDLQCITFNSNEGINGDGSLEICSKSASPNDFIVNNMLHTSMVFLQYIQ